MFSARYIARQINGGRRQAVVFVLCVALSMVTLVSLGSFSRNVKDSLFKDARALHAADVTVRAHAPIPAALSATLEALQTSLKVRTARFYEFYSVVRRQNGEGSLLANLKVVEPGYPFYGEVRLASGRPLSQVLTSGNAVVEPGLLERLKLKVGDQLCIGELTLTVRDQVLSEPDRPVNFFALGPRILLSASDLAALKLVGRGSRVDYVVLVKVYDPKQLDTIAEQLRRVGAEERVRVETYRSADSRVKRFFDNLLFFLNLIGVFTLLLAGIGIQSTLGALIKEQKRTIAVMKALGARSRFIIGHYLGLSLVLGLMGTLLGLAASLVLQQYLPGLFQGLVPARAELALSYPALAEGAFLGFAVVLLFTALPLYRLKEVKPRAIFDKEEAPFPARGTTVIVACSCLLFLALLLWRIEDAAAALYFTLGLLALLLLVFVLASILLRLLKSHCADSLPLRQAIRGLFRPRNATRAILVTLTSALTVIFAITLVEKNLDASFVRSFPANAPNLFFIDIQPGQRSAFAKTLGRRALYYPVVRGVVVAVNRAAIDPAKEREKRGDNLGREFNLTYRERLLEDEQVISGKTLFRKDWDERQVSVLDTVVKMHRMRVGDTLSFRIQGIPITARISSVRSRSGSALTPYFYFVFPERLLEEAPHTFFTAIRVEPREIGSLQDRIAARFPNVSSIDLTETVAVFASLMERLSRIVRFFTSFSIIAGMLILIGSIFATRYARIQEAVYFTVLGARRRFVLAVFSLESLLLGFLSALTALLLSQVASFLICRQVLDLSYRSFPAASLALVLVAVLLVVAVGLAASFSVLTQKPSHFLREQTDE